MGRIAEALKKAQQDRARHVKHAAVDVELGADQASRSTSNERATFSPELSRLKGKAEIFRPSQPKIFKIDTTPIPPESVAPSVMACHDPNTAIAEKYRSIRTRLLTSNPKQNPRILAITSSIPKEGKTTTVANLGFSLAELSKIRVAMVDLDLRRRGLTRAFQAQDQPGIADVLRGEKTLAEVCRLVVKSNLYFVPAGKTSRTNISELLGDPRMAALFKELSEQFNYSLIDTPPVNSSADIGLIGPLCHSALMIVRLNKTPEPISQRCVRMLQANHISITGCIATGCHENNSVFSDVTYGDSADN